MTDIANLLLSHSVVTKQSGDQRRRFISFRALRFISAPALNYLRKFAMQLSLAMKQTRWERPTLWSRKRPKYNALPIG